MPGNEVLTDLLNQDGLTHPNSDLLKKYVLCLHRGWFRVNNAPPSDQFSLGDYLLDDERVVLDFTHLTEREKAGFLEWFLKPHGEHANRAFLSGVKTTDYRGYTAEVPLSWWGRITNLLFYKKKSWEWPLTPLDLVPNAQLEINHQINGLELCEGANGLLISLNQLGADEQPGKYQAPGSIQNGLLRNTKRVYLTADLVKRLKAIRLEDEDFNACVNQPHPYAVPIRNQNAYYKSMKNYRHTQRLEIPLSWYKRIWKWILSWFNPKQADEPCSNNFVLLASHDGVEIYQREEDRAILISEKRPDLNTAVLSGGGAKIFGHVGAYGEFERAGIKPIRFAGSSAGAIMALLCYLGYNTTEILEFFQRFRKDNLVFYNIDRSGISDTRAVRAALDYMIVKKIDQIIKRYHLNSTEDGRDFLSTQVFGRGKITFQSLQKLKEYCPECEIGEQLVVTATNVRARKTRYFSHEHSPHTEVSQAVTLSASFPLLFKPTLFHGDLHSDGGVLSNLPTEAFRGDHSTFLESAYGNCLSLIAFQFDNGPEGGLLRTLLNGRVYRENFFLNWIYGLITGVSDPVSGWEKDRLKLLQHGGQNLLIPTGNVSATQLDVDAETQNFLKEQGRIAAEDYINARYCRDKTTGKATNDECMHAKFTGIEELLYYACHRKHADWFGRLADIAVKQGVSSEKVEALWHEHFVSMQPGLDSDEDDDIAVIAHPRTRDTAERNTLFSVPLSVYREDKQADINMDLFQSLYPVFLHLPDSFFKNSRDLQSYKAGRHSFSLHAPFACLNDFDKIKGEVHVLFAMLRELIHAVQNETADANICYAQFTNISSLIQRLDLNKPAFYGHWALQYREYNRIVKSLQRDDINLAINLCDGYKRNEEPMEYMDIAYETGLQESDDEIYSDPMDYTHAINL